MTLYCQKCTCILPTCEERYDSFAARHSTYVDIILLRACIHFVQHLLSLEIALEAYFSINQNQTVRRVSPTQNPP